jgi:hypothetical protein
MPVGTLFAPPVYARPNTLLWSTAGLCGLGHTVTIKRACHNEMTLKHELLSARPSYVRSGKHAVGPKKVPTAYPSHMNVINFLHPGPGPDCPLTRIRGLELMRAGLPPGHEHVSCQA